VTQLPGSMRRLYFLFQAPGDAGNGTEFWAFSRLGTAWGYRGEEWRGVREVEFVGWRAAPSQVRFLAGSTLYHNGLYELFLSLASTGDRREGSIRRASSQDGFLFQFATEEVLASAPPYEAGGSMVMWRDPYPVWAGGRWLMFLSATLSVPSTSARHVSCWRGVHTSALTREEFCSFEQDRGVIATAEAETLQGPWRLLPPAAHEKVPRDYVELGSQSAFTEMERPQVLHHGGHWHLFFSCWKKMVNPSWVKRHLLRTASHQEFTDSALYHFISLDPKGPYKPAPSPIVAGSGHLGLYGVQVVALPNSDTHDVVAWFIKGNALAVGDDVQFRWKENGRPELFVP